MYQNTSYRYAVRHNHHLPGGNIRANKVLNDSFLKINLHFSTLSSKSLSTVLNLNLCLLAFWFISNRKGWNLSYKNEKGCLLNIVTGTSITQIYIVWRNAGPQSFWVCPNAFHFHFFFCSALKPYTWCFWQPCAPLKGVERMRECLMFLFLRHQ